MGNRVVVHGVVLDAKLSFEIHIRLIDASASSKAGIKRKALCVLDYPVQVFLELHSSSPSVLLSCLKICSDFSSSFLFVCHQKRSD